MASTIFWTFDEVARWVRTRYDPNGRGALLNPEIGHPMPARVEFESIDIDSPATEQTPPSDRKAFDTRLRKILEDEQIRPKIGGRLRWDGESREVELYERRLVKRVFPGVPGRRRHFGLELSDDEALKTYRVPRFGTRNLPSYLLKHFLSVIRRRGVLPNLEEIQRMAEILCRITARDLVDQTYIEEVGLARLHLWHLGRGHTRLRPGRSIGFPELVRATFDYIEKNALETEVPLTELEHILFPGRGGARLPNGKEKAEGQV